MSFLVIIYTNLFIYITPSTFITEGVGKMLKSANQQLNKLTNVKKGNILTHFVQLLNPKLSLIALLSHRKTHHLWFGQNKCLIHGVDVKIFCLYRPFSSHSGCVLCHSDSQLLRCSIRSYFRGKKTTTN